MANLARFTQIGKKVVAVGRNYAEHAAELGNAVPSKPLLFMKVIDFEVKLPLTLPRKASVSLHRGWAEDRNTHWL